MMLISYRYVHAGTESTTGYFSCEPPESLTLDAALDQLEQTPLDTFLHRHVLRRLGEMTDAERNAFVVRRYSPVTSLLLAEWSLLHSNRRTGDSGTVSAGLTPLPYLDGIRPADDDRIAAWNRLFEANLTLAHPLPHPDDGDPPLPEYACTLQPVPSGLTVAAVYAELVEFTQLADPTATPRWERPPAQETSMQALANLAGAGVIAGVEMRHESSLSPVGLLRNWNVDVSVREGGLAYTLQGEATTWGRGCTLADARASCAMEMIERASAYLSVADGQILDRLHPAPLLKSSWDDLTRMNKKAIDPARLSPAIPTEGNTSAKTLYHSMPLYWMEGSSPTGETILVPAQAVGLFWNLDEPELFASPGSTGLASGNTMEEAKVAALTEIIERDAEATVPWRREQCFELVVAPDTPEHVYLAALLDDYKKHGIHVRFRDMTTEFGLPCYQSFVIRQDGSLARGTGAGLSGIHALLSALTETPFPYPNGPASAPPPAGLAQRSPDDFPDYRLESPDRNLTLLETVLTAHGHSPMYVSLTREDLEFPVVRAIVPDLASAADFDRFSRPPARLFARFLA